MWSSPLDKLWCCNNCRHNHSHSDTKYQN